MTLLHPTVLLHGCQVFSTTWAPSKSAPPSPLCHSHQELGLCCPRTGMQRYSSTQLFGISAFEHHLLDITTLNPLQARDAGWLPVISQQDAGVWKQGACPRHPWDALAYSVPVYCGRAPQWINQCPLKTIRVQRDAHHKEKSNCQIQLSLPYMTEQLTTHWIWMKHSAEKRCLWEYLKCIVTKRMELHRLWWCNISSCSSNLQRSPVYHNAGVDDWQRELRQVRQDGQLSPSIYSP